MPKVRYIGAIDEVDVVGVGTFQRDDELEVTDDQAKSLLAQPDNFAPIKDAMDVMTKAELESLATERGVDLTGLTTKADISAAIKKG